jgi:UDP-hydrolysing UDP-N-acetyl-D-glucosamine 2-epimerase
VKVAVPTGSRADYGLLRPTLDALEEDSRFALCLLVTAMHLDPVYGDTIAEIEDDDREVTAYVPAGGPVRMPGDFARNLGHATVAFTDALAACAPDVLLVLGDRFETLAAALAATSLGIPIAHLHGGELSEGSLDDATRHCVTKLSHLHFVATHTYAERVCQLGEDPSRVYVVGATGLESIRRLPLLDRAQLARTLELNELNAPLLVLTLHPTSLRADRAAAHARALTSAIDEVLRGAGCVVVTLPNDDPGNAVLRQELTSWAQARANVHVFDTLGQLLYLSLLSHVDAVLGNSSSAIIEAPSFHVPVVNVGERQRGRMMAANILSCDPQKEAVAKALRRSLDPAFRASLVSTENPHDHGDVARHVLTVLAAASLAELRDKRFFDLPDASWRAQLELARAPVEMARTP